MIEITPEIVCFTPNLDEDLVEMPTSVWRPTHRFRSPLTDLAREVRPEAIDPEPDAFVTHVDASFVQ
jgi:hypothetical protein